MSRETGSEEVNPKQPPQAPPKGQGVLAAMAVAVLLGGVLGAALGALFLPGLIVACALGGAMLLAAVRVAIFMSPNRKGLAPVDEEDGTGQ